MRDREFQVGDRRPIPARELKLSQKFAGWLAKSGATANSISVAGLLAGLAAGGAIAATSFFPEYFVILYILGALLIFSRLLANMFDGMVAVILAKPNPLGELFNEVPDRLSDAAILIGCGYSIKSSPEAGFLAALFAVLTAYIRSLGKAAGASQNFAGPMAKQQRMFLCIATCFLCAFMPTSLVMFSPAEQGPAGGGSIMGPVLWFIAAGSAYTCIRRLAAISRDLKQVK
jgi:phosphatidylglycerophosphate synthase